MGSDSKVAVGSSVTGTWVHYMGSDSKVAVGSSVTGTWVHCMGSDSKVACGLLGDRDMGALHG